MFIPTLYCTYSTVVVDPSERRGIRDSPDGTLLVRASENGWPPPSCAAAVDKR